jgi:ribonuclease inhibitor
MKIDIDGNDIRTEAAFHRALATALDLPYYGGNLDALWDVLSAGVERPLLLVWRNASLSLSAMPERFDAIVQVLRRVERQDAEWALPERFELHLSQ